MVFAWIFFLGPYFKVGRVSGPTPPTPVRSGTSRLPSWKLTWAASRAPRPSSSGTSTSSRRLASATRPGAAPGALAFQGGLPGRTGGKAARKAESEAGLEPERATLDDRVAGYRLPIRSKAVLLEKVRPSDLAPLPAERAKVAAPTREDPTGRS